MFNKQSNKPIKVYKILQSWMVPTKFLQTIKNTIKLFSKQSETLIKFIVEKGKAH